MTNAQLMPLYPTADAARALQGQKAKQQHHYDKHARDLSPITAGDTVRMRLPGQKTWTPGICTGLLGPRSYGVRVGDREYRRNRRQLLHTKEQLPRESPIVELGSDTPVAGQEDSPSMGERPDRSEAPDPPESPAPRDHIELGMNTPAHTEPNPISNMPAQQLPRRSERVRKPPDRLSY
jgi:hypothetical protein